MRLLTLDTDLVEILEELGCTREHLPLPTGSQLLVVVGPPELLLDPRGRRRPRAV